MRKVYALLAGVGAVLLSPLALAAIPAEATAALDTLVTDAGAFVADFWPLLIAVVLGFVFFKLFRKGTNKAT